MHCFILYDGECRPLQERHEWRPGADRELMVGICVQKDRAWAGRERTDLLVVYGRVLPGAWQTWLLLLMFSLSPPVWLTFTASLSCVSPVSSPLSGPSELIVWLRMLESVAELRGRAGTARACGYATPSAGSSGRVAAALKSPLQVNAQSDSCRHAFCHSALRVCMLH